MVVEVGLPGRVQEPRPNAAIASAYTEWHSEALRSVYGRSTQNKTCETERHYLQSQDQEGHTLLEEVANEWWPLPYAWWQCWVKTEEGKARIAAAVKLRWQT
jgi:hypothetical protein